ncbi:MAG: SDR family oxidoreductase, partial [Nitriliruptoraceae bacterium]
AMVHAAEAAHGPLDLMVSNAGVATGVGLEAAPDDWDRSWRINVLAHVHAARAALPGMLERGRGGFVHTCSAAGLLTMVGDAPYTVTQHAAVAFAAWLAVTSGDRGIEVVALCPQGVDTALLAEADAGLAGRAVRAAGRVLSPDEVATSALAALREQRFLALPHPEVGEHERARATDRDRWLAGIRRLSAALER